MWCIAQIPFTRTYLSRVCYWDTDYFSLRVGNSHCMLSFCFPQLCFVQLLTSRRKFCMWISTWYGKFGAKCSPFCTGRFEESGWIPCKLWFKEATNYLQFMEVRCEASSYHRQTRRHSFPSLCNTSLWNAQPEGSLSQHHTGYITPVNTFCSG